jgi:hypothetical protein
MIFGTPPIVTQGSVLHLDAGSRQSYPGSGTTWADLSGTNNSGSLTNGPTFDIANQGSISFNGSNQYVNCGQGLAQAGDWSISAFARINSTGVAKVVVARTGGADTSYAQNYAISYGGYTGNNGTKFALGTSADSYKAAIGTTTVLANTWYCITGTYNSTSKILSIYVNSVLEGTATGTTLPPTTGNQYFQVGCSDGVTTPAGYWPGLIAQVQLYNRALSAQEVNQNYNALKNRFGLT